MDELRGKLTTSVSLASHTSWKVGGIAKRCYQPHDLKDLIHFLSTTNDQAPLLWLGLGSNTLIREKGFDGTVILLKGGALSAIQRLDELTLRVEAGVASPVLARWCAKEGLAGLEFLAGIPGTLGGALAMNAGAYGSEIWDFVLQVETVDLKGQCHIRECFAYEVGYRTVRQYPKEWFTAAYLSLNKDSPRLCQKRIQTILKHRSDTQPNQRSAGSVFQNHLLGYAGKLIEQCGLKGIRLGGAMVSEKHANFIINRGNAKSTDIERLISFISQEVYNRYSIELDLEVHIYPKVSNNH